MGQNEDLSLAHRLADEAGRVAMSWFRGPFTSRTKADGSLVTEADEAVEDAVRAILARERPDDAVLGEERGRTGEARRLWLVDGIDGTDSFARGELEWGCLIALQVDGRTVLGIAEQAPQARRCWAALGLGAYRRAAGGPDEPLRVSRRTRLSDATGFVPPPSWCRDDESVGLADAMASAVVPAPVVDHPALQVAWGGSDAAMFFECGPWDLAAPALIVEEAGGRFSDLSGGDALDTGRGLYTNGLIHNDLLAVLGGW